MRVFLNGNAGSTVLNGKVLNVNLTFANDDGSLSSWITVENKDGLVLGELELDRKHFCIPENTILPRGAKKELFKLGPIAARIRKEISYRLGLQRRKFGTGRPMALEFVPVAE